MKIMKILLLVFAIFLPFSKGSIITPQDMDRLILLDDILDNLQHLGRQRAILNYISIMQHQRSCDSGQIWKHGGCQNIKTKRRFKFNPMRLVELIKKRYELNGKKTISKFLFF